jgi:DNA-binding CsgD family transcriptional regulator/PAS domain-containing protein
LTLPPKILSDIYAAAVDIEAWDALPDRLAQYLEVNTVGLWLLRQGMVTDITTTQTHRESMAPYLAHFHQLDPWSRSIALAPSGSTFLGAELADERALLKSEFYNDFARFYGHLRPLGAKIDVSSGVNALIAVENRYTRRPFEVEDKARVEPILPHLQRMLQLRGELTPRQKQMHSGVAALNALNFGVIVCNRQARVVFVNEAAESLDRSREGLRILRRNGTVGLDDMSRNRRLLELIESAITGNAGGVLRIENPTYATHVIAMVSPLPIAFNDNNVSSCAMITLRTLLSASQFSVRFLAQALELTPTQSAIALQLLNGLSVEEIAAERNSQVSTVRTHLAEIFARTKTTNQRDLVRLLGSFPPVKL